MAGRSRIIFATVIILIGMMAPVSAHQPCNILWADEIEAGDICVMPNGQLCVLLEGSPSMDTVRVRCYRKKAKKVRRKKQYRKKRTRSKYRR